MLRYVTKSGEEGEKGREMARPLLSLCEWGVRKLEAGGMDRHQDRKGEGRPHRLPPLTWRAPPPSNQGTGGAGLLRGGVKAPPLPVRWRT